MSPFQGNAPRGLAVAFLSAVLLASCSKLLPTQPSSQAQQLPAPNAETLESQLFYPLNIGNHWNYESSFSVQIVPEGGSPGSPDVIHSTLDYDLIGTEQRHGREYVVQRETYRSSTQTIESNFLYRQDFSGLFNADPEPSDEVDAATSQEALAAGSSLDHALTELASRLDPSKRRALAPMLEKVRRIQQVAFAGSQSRGRGHATPGPLSGEIAFLRYPIHAQASWQVREDPLVLYTVEGQETLSLPAGTFNGWRIRIEWPDFFGPNDRIHVWYGRDGFLKMAYHLEGSATDEQGNPVGRVIAELEQELVGLGVVVAGS